MLKNYKLFSEPPDNSKQKSLPSPQSNIVILVTPDLSKYPIFSNQFSFPLEIQKIGIQLWFWNDNTFIRRKNCERFCFYWDSSTFVQYMLSGIVFFFSGNKVTATPKSKGARTPMYLWDEDYNAYKKQYAS